MTSPAQAKPHYDHLDGIRGLAIALVVVFHIFVGKVSSGVDVFLFIGGLLLISSQLRNVADPNGRTLGCSLLRIVRRLLPALVTVVGASVIGVLILYSRVELGSLFGDASAAVLHWLNWRLIGVDAEYDAAGSATTPFQHLWSMSVQLQVYLLIIVLIHLARRLPKARVILAISVLTVGSFVYATVLSLSGQQAMNYYSTLSRFWEIGAGGLLGLVILTFRPSALTRTVLSWVGLVLILSVGIFFDGAQQFPGPLTLIPLLGALCLVVSGLDDRSASPGESAAPGGTATPGEPASASPSGVRAESARRPPVIVRCLESAPAVELGRLAYSLYLWHWPLLIFGVKVTGLEAKNPLLGVPIIVVSLGLAWVTYLYVEIPLRSSRAVLRPAPKPARVPASTATRVRRLRSLGLAAGFVLVIASPLAVSAAASVQQTSDETRIAEAVAEGRDDSYPGAAEVLDDVAPRDDVPIYPSLVDRTQMMPAATSDECMTDLASTAIITHKADGSACEYGDVTAERELYVVGGSHSEQWLGALDTIGRERGIRIVPFLRSGCPLYYGGEDDANCDAWSRSVEKRIYDSPPSEGVFMVSTRPQGGDAGHSDYVPPEYQDVFSRIAEADIPIFAVRDNPWLKNDRGEQLDPRACAAQDPAADDCAVPAEAEFARSNPAEAVLTDPRIIHLDLTEALIKEDAVRPVIGNVLVYRDWNHLTDQYVRTLAPELERQMYPVDHR
ncbi:MULTISPECIES: acyltransferase family protein [unclassified Brevibacterium]|uniref:acyltransferase family protein n=1 Tax=unclassified Brevibacterium TaxID=2614124 RepID=UPI001E356FC5|nr:MULTISPECIES: acyltransferase family protein [unclassified Brevibacterium]MCD1284382.1 acyltransferase [Brevibacterium sp. CCUG 69071]MDK8436005.1 acyltransferase family protein [Brevibacterium sp. H-BE7]